MLYAKTRRRRRKDRRPHDPAGDAGPRGSSVVKSAQRRSLWETPLELAGAALASPPMLTAVPIAVSTDGAPLSWVAV